MLSVYLSMLGEVTENGHLPSVFRKVSTNSVLILLSPPSLSGDMNSVGTAVQSCLSLYRY